MEYLPRLIPVEVREPKAKIWFHSLLSGVDHLHKHGIVHNDIKPANILLSRTEQPVLVDFGFAERYELLDGAESYIEVVKSPVRKEGLVSASLPKRKTIIMHPLASGSASLLLPSTKPVPFESSLAYGTPEYLSPERARGYKHDTRKSDVWSLGVTFFEVITGRTPFEVDDENGNGEEFTSKEDLERYWNRTNKGTWVGAWKMTSGLEAVLKRMLRPNAKERVLADEALADLYWAAPIMTAEITAMRVTANGKIQPTSTAIVTAGLAGDFQSHPSTSRPASPNAIGTARSKLSVLQNFITKQPQLPPSIPHASLSLKPSAPIEKGKGKENRKSLHDVFLPSRPKSAASSKPPTPNPADASASFDVPSLPPRPKSFFGSGSLLGHKRTKSAGTAITTNSASGTQLTPKAVAHPPPPRVPPPTPATPLAARTNATNAKNNVPPVPALRAGMGRPLNVAVAVGAALMREVDARHLTEESLARQQSKVVPVDVSSIPTAIPTRVQSSKTEAVLPTTAPLAPAPAPAPERVLAPAQISRISPKKPIRSPLRPVPGKENGYVKFKVRAIESKNAAPSTSNPIAPPGKLGVNTGAGQENGGVGTARGALRMKDRNAGGLGASTNTQPRDSVLLAKGKAPIGVGARNEKGNAVEKGLSPKRSLLKKNPSGALKKKENMPMRESNSHLAVPTSASLEKDKESRGKRALHAISRSVDLSKGNATTSISHLGHRVRKSIDKTFGKMSNGPNTVSKRPSGLTLELKESWEDLEKERANLSAAKLDSVPDTSYETAPQSPAPKQELTSTQEAEVPEEDPELEASRMRQWIQGIERAATETVESFDREGTIYYGRKSSSKTTLFRPTRSSTEPSSPSLPPPKRRGSTSSRRMLSTSIDGFPTIDASFRSTTPAVRLSAVLDENDKRLLLEGGKHPRAMSVGSIESSSPPTEMPTIPTINPNDLISPHDILNYSEMDRSIAVESLPDDYFNPADQSFVNHRTQSPYHDLEPSRSYVSPNNTTLDLSRLAREIGVNQHPWALPRTSTSASPNTSTPNFNESFNPTRPSSPAPPRPATSLSQYHNQTRRSQTPAARAATPLSFKEPPEKQIFSSENVVRVGKGYESSRSHTMRTVNGPVYHDQHVSEFGAGPSTSSPHLLAPVEHIAPRPSNNVRAATTGKKNGHRRSGMFATFLGRDAHNTHAGISSETYFAGVGEFGTTPEAVGTGTGARAASTSHSHEGPGTGLGHNLVPPPIPHDPWAEFDSEEPRSNTLSKRLKKAFSRVVSNPGLNRAIAV